MRKFISIFMVIAIMLSLTTTAFAATLNQDTPSGEALVVYKAGETVDDNGTPDNPADDIVIGTYTVTIPAYIAVADVGAAPTEYDVVAKDVLIPYGTSLKVAVAFDELELGSVTLDYDMQANPQKAGSLASIASGDTILTVAAGNPTAVTTSTIGAVLTSAPLYSGVYTDTATFTISVA